ncbi:MAG: hypothetical protein AAFQ07_18795 [Chloroflexota bacterium]
MIHRVMGMWLIMSLFVLVGGVFAQDTDDYEWEIASLEFEYPEDWEIEETEQGTIRRTIKVKPACR